MTDEPIEDHPVEPQSDDDGPGGHPPPPPPICPNCNTRHTGACLEIDPKP